MNKTYIVIAIILALGILGYGYMNFRSKANDRQQELSRTQSNVQNLNLCLATAQRDFNITFNNNSYDVGGGLSRWDSLTIQNGAYKKLESDKDLCAKLFGN